MTYPTFDPNNPHAFESLSYRKQQELSRKDQEAYDEEDRLYAEWCRAEELRHMQNPCTVEGEAERAADSNNYKRWEKQLSETEQGTYQANTIKTRMAQRIRSMKERAHNQLDSSKWLTRLGRALEGEGYTVTYHHGWGFNYRDENGQEATVHETWATKFFIWKDDQKVGEVAPWRPQNGYYRSQRVIGWKVVTNRHNDGYNTNPKRYKVVESALKHIKATAIPSRTIEHELKDAEFRLHELRKRTAAARNTAYEAEHGVTKGYNSYSPDGTLQKIMEAYETQSNADVMELVKQAYDRWSETILAFGAAEEEQEHYEREVVTPLRKKAAEEVPEVYS